MYSPSLMRPDANIYRPDATAKFAAFTQLRREFIFAPSAWSERDGCAGGRKMAVISALFPDAHAAKVGSEPRDREILENSSAAICNSPLPLATNQPETHASWRSH